MTYMIDITYAQRPDYAQTIEILEAEGFEVQRTPIVINIRGGFTP